MPLDGDLTNATLDAVAKNIWTTSSARLTTEMDTWDSGLGAVESKEFP